MKTTFDIGPKKEDLEILSNNLLKQKELHINKNNKLFFSK